MLQSILIWHKWPDEKPPESGEYLALSGSHCFQNLLYSKRYEVFNALDTDLPSEVAEFGINPDYWCNTPILSENISQE